MTDKFNFKVYFSLINLDANSPHGCWLPCWPAQQNCILFLGNAKLSRVLRFFRWPRKTIFSQPPPLQFSLCRHSVFPPGQSQILLQQHHVTSSGLKGTGLHFIESAHKQEKACNFYRCLFPDRKAIPKPNADEHVC